MSKINSVIPVGRRCQETSTWSPVSKSSFACRHQLIPYIAVCYISRHKFEHFQLFLFLFFYKHFQRFLFRFSFIAYRETTSHVQGCAGQPQPKSTLYNLIHDYFALGVIPLVPRSTTVFGTLQARLNSLQPQRTTCTHHELRRKPTTGNVELPHAYRTLHVHSALQINTTHKRGTTRPPLS